MRSRHSIGRQTASCLWQSPELTGIVRQPCLETTAQPMPASSMRSLPLFFLHKKINNSNRVHVVRFHMMILVKYFAPFWGLKSTLAVTLLLLFIYITQKPLSCQESSAQCRGHVCQTLPMHVSNRLHPRGKMVCASVCMCLCISVYVSLCVCMYVIYVSVYVCVNVCVHAQ